VLNVTVFDEAEVAEPLALEAPPSCRIVASGAWALRLHGPEGPDRRRVEAMVEQTSAQAFGGRLRRHYPCLMSLEDEAGRILGAAGFRRAADERLFLEQYLDAPVEAVATARLGREIPRTEIAEIGGLACRAPGASIVLFAGLARRLARSGHTVAAATTTGLLRRTFVRAGFDCEPLTEARADRLDGGPDDWGDYYACAPIVMAGRIAPCLEALDASLAGGLKASRSHVPEMAEVRA
jgi:hypothetical protein